MSSRYHDYDKGSSRSARDDSRRHERADSRREDRRRSRSRSRSPRRRFSPRNSTEERTPRSQDRDRRDHDRRERNKSPNSLEHEENVPAPPPPPRITKISIDFTKPKAPIKMSIGGAPKPTAAPKPAVASVFNNDDDEEPEEMPAEAKMRMRNIGRETPTSAGPNSFGKTKQGFCDAKKVFEKNLKQALETAEKPSGSKFPQTIYKIKGP